MSEEVTTAVIAALGVVMAALVARWLGRPGQLRDPRHEIERDLKILAELPEGSAAAPLIRESVDARLTALLTASGGERRHWFGVNLGVIMLLLFGILAWRTATWGGWWWFAAVPAGLIAAAMLIVIPQDFKKVARNEKGQALT